MTLPEQARALHVEGLGYKRIAARLGVPRDKARDWVRPRRRRKKPCGICGRPKDRDAALCRRCRSAEAKAMRRARHCRWIGMREAGLLNHEIAERDDVDRQSVANGFVLAKAEGLSVPRSPYFNR